MLGAILWLLSPLAFTSCDSPDAEVEVSLSSDYSGIAEAIVSGSQTLSEKLSLIESAVTGGFADHNAAEKLLQQALTSMDGTLEQKLAAIEAAVNSEAVSLSTKLNLIGAAASCGFADSAEQQALIKAAIDSVTGDAGAKIAAIETAVQGQTASLSMKLGLIETAVKEGLANEKEGLELLHKAVGSLSDNGAERIAAILDAMSGQAASLSAKLDLLSVTIEKGLTKQNDALALIHKAVESLDGTAEENLAEVETVIQRQQLSLETELGLIESAVANGFAGSVAKEALLKQAIESLVGTGGTAETYLAAIEEAVNSESETLSSKLVLIGTAVNEGFAADSMQTGLIKDAIAALPGSIKEKLDAINTAMELQTASLDVKLETIQLTYADSLANALEAVELIGTALTSLDKSLFDILKELHSITETSMARLLVEDLTNIRYTIQQAHDYSEILEAISAAIADLNIPLTLEFEKFVKDGVLVMGRDTLLLIPFKLPRADLQVDATASDGIMVEVRSDSDNPDGGFLAIKADSINGTSNVEVSVTSKLNSKKHKIKIIEAQLTAEDGQDLILNYNQTGTYEFRYRTNASTTVLIPDTETPWIHRVYDTEGTESTTDSVVRVLIDVNKGFYDRSSSVKIISDVSKDVLSFSIYQRYNSERVYFAPSNSSLQTAFVMDTKHINFNKDDYISMAEAAAVTSLDSLFGVGLMDGQTPGHKCEYTSFDEFVYFTGIDTIPAGSFHNWVNLTSITLPPSIKVIMGGYGDEDGPFTDCPKLEAIKGKFSVDDKMLVYKKKLLKVAETATSVTIPEEGENAVKIIGTKAFYHSNVTNVKIPKSVKVIRDHAFEFSQIESVEFSMNGTDVGAAKSYADSLAESSFVHCFRLKQFVGPKNNESVIRVTPDNHGLCRDTTLYAYALGADATQFVIPESMGVKRLGESVFDLDIFETDLNQIGLPATLTNIRHKAFGSQSGIELYFRGGNPPIVEPDAFVNTTDKTITIYVPAVMNGSTVDEAATNARIGQFETAMGMGTGYFIFNNYSSWPFNP